MRQHQLLINLARQKGMIVEDLSPYLDSPAALLLHQDKTELIVDGVPMSLVNAHGMILSDHKHLTKQIYERAGLPYLKSMVFQEAQEEMIHDFMVEGASYVCKPVDSTNGIGVQLNINTYAEVVTYLRHHHTLSGPFLLEEQAEGYDLRIHALGGRLVAACTREPAYVRGDGQATLQQLIQRRQTEMQQQNPNNFLEVDAVTEELLKAQQLQLEDIIPDGKKVLLKSIANMAQGAIATDVTADIHEQYHEWVAALSDHLQTGYFGLDLMTRDHRKDPSAYTKILEVNARADWLHHTFSLGRTHDMAAYILAALFD